MHRSLFGLPTGTQVVHGTNLLLIGAQPLLNFRGLLCAARGGSSGFSDRGWGLLSTSSIFLFVGPFLRRELRGVGAGEEERVFVGSGLLLRRHDCWIMMMMIVEEGRVMVGALCVVGEGRVRGVQGLGGVGRQLQPHQAGLVVAGLQQPLDGRHHHPQHPVCLRPAGHDLRRPRRLALLAAARLRSDQGQGAAGGGLLLRQLQLVTRIGGSKGFPE